MNEDQSYQEAKEIVNHSAELYQHENEALAIANLYEDIEFSKDNPTLEDALKTGRAEEALEEAREKADEYAAENIDAIHRVANAEGLYREPERAQADIAEE